LDPLLAEHLSHWGINMMSLEKTEKTMAELQVSLNLEHDWSKITEDGADIEPLTGPGFVGLANLGNSCYLASVMQCLLSTEEIPQRSVAHRAPSFALLPWCPPLRDLTTRCDPRYNPSGHAWSPTTPHLWRPAPLLAVA